MTSSGDYYEAVDNNGDGKIDKVIRHFADTTNTREYAPTAWTQAQLDKMVRTTNGVTSPNGTPKPEVPNELPPPAKLPPDTSTLGNVNPPKYDGSGGDGEVTVNTDALRQFSAFLDRLGEPLKTLKTDVDKVAVHPGAFYQAFHLKNAVHSDPSLQTNTSKVIAQTLDAFASIKQGITKLIAEYDSAEELNSVSAEDLKKVLSSASTIITKLSGTS